MSKIPLSIFDENFLSSIFALESKNLLPEFPFNYPPIIVGRKKFRQDEILSGWKFIGNMTDEELVIYVHIPFCDYICKFCGFYRELKNSDKMVDNYLEALLKEIFLYSNVVRKKDIKWLCFGGGTPSVLSEQHLELLFSIFRKNFNISENTGIAFESSPYSLDFSKVKLLEQLGVKYLAIGVQSFDENLMERYSRPQTKNQCLKAIENAKKAGIKNIEIDLIVGLPGQSEESFMSDIDIVSKLDVERVYVFDYQPRFLTCEVNEKKSASLTENELERARDLRRKGIEKLLKSGYSLSCGHWVYKRGGHSWPYSYDQQEEGGYSILALGPSAIGYCKGKFRYQNFCNTEKYISFLNSGFLPVEKFLNLSKRDEMVNYILLSFIQRGQLNVCHFQKKFHKNIMQYFKKEMSKMIEMDLVFKTKDLFVVTNRHKAIFAAKAIFYSPEVIRKLADIFGVKIINSRKKISYVTDNFSIPFLDFLPDMKKIAMELKGRISNGQRKVIFTGKNKEYVFKLPFLMKLAKRVGFNDILAIIDFKDTVFLSKDEIWGNIIVNFSSAEINKINECLSKVKKSLIGVMIQIEKLPENFDLLIKNIRRSGFRKIIFYFSLKPDIRKINPPDSYSKYKKLFKKGFESAKKYELDIKFLDIPLCVLHPYEGLFYSFKDLSVGDARESDANCIKLSGCLNCKYLLLCNGPEKSYLKKFGYMEIKAVK